MKYALFFFICMNMCALLSGYPPVFTSLEAITKYAQEHPEYPANDSSSWTHPNYNSFLTQITPNWWDHLLYRLHIKSWPLWHIWGFYDLLLQVTTVRENQGYIERFIEKKVPDYGDTFIIWSDMQGAFHSLVRSLHELAQQEIINDDLVIMKQNYYFVFNGNMITASAYNLELLTVILRLMQINPDKVFYIRGSYEDKGHWKNFNLKHDLILRARILDASEFPLAAQMDRFFNTLPLALYLKDTTQKIVQLLRISFFGRDYTELNEQIFKDFFNQVYDSKHIFPLNKTVNKPETEVAVKAIIEGEERTTRYRVTPGLMLLEADQGATAWTVLSGPTQSYQQLQDFYYDAFAVLQIDKIFDTSTIALYHQDVRNRLGFTQYAQFNVMTGQKEIDSITRIDEVLDLKERLRAAKKEINRLEYICQLYQEKQEEI